MHQIHTRTAKLCTNAQTHRHRPLERPLSEAAELWARSVFLALQFSPFLPRSSVSRYDLFRTLIFSRDPPRACGHQSSWLTIHAPVLRREGSSFHSSAGIRPLLLLLTLHSRNLCYVSRKSELLNSSASHRRTDVFLSLTGAHKVPNPNELIAASEPTSSLCPARSLDNFSLSLGQLTIISNLQMECNR